MIREGTKISRCIEEKTERRFKKIIRYDCWITKSVGSQAMSHFSLAVEFCQHEALTDISAK